MSRLGLLTIGQSPRADITTELRPYLSESVTIIEAGVLNGMTCEQVKKGLSPSEGDIVYVSRMADGTQVTLSKSKIIPLMQKKIDKLVNEGAELIAILCSGEFPDFKSKVPLIYPDKILKGCVQSISYAGIVGVLIPLREQVACAKEKWGSYFRDLEVAPISPYTSTEDEFLGIGYEFKKMNIRLIIMDCIGYTLKQRYIVKRQTGSFIISTRTLVAKALAELLLDR